MSNLTIPAHPLPSTTTSSHGLIAVTKNSNIDTDALLRKGYGGTRP